MDNTPKNRLKNRCYAISYLLLLMPVAQLVFLAAWPRGIPHAFLIDSWMVSIVIGCLCVFIGSGLMSKKPIETLGNLALALHITSLVVLVAYELCNSYDK
ncbi:MAG: hypothetical protein WCO56_13860 [Verrucomicrobiota bacterium]